MAFSLRTSARYNRPTRDGRVVTVNLNECVIVTTGTLASTSVTDNRHNFLHIRIGPHIRSNTVDKDEEGGGDLQSEQENKISSSTTSECHNR